MINCYLRRARITGRDRLTQTYAVSEAAVYNCRAKYGVMDVSEVTLLRALEGQNAKLNKRLANQMLEAAALRELPEKMPVPDMIAPDHGTAIIANVIPSRKSESEGGRHYIARSSRGGTTSLKDRTELCVISFYMRHYSSASATRGKRSATGSPIIITEARILSAIMRRKRHTQAISPKNTMVAKLTSRDDHQLLHLPARVY